MWLDHLLTFFLLHVSDVAASIGSGKLKTDLCNSPIYCHSLLLKTVQLANIFPDSKTFVDMYLLNAPNKTLESFDELMSATGGKPNKIQVALFVSENFAKKNELIPWVPPDWKSRPSILEKIRDEVVREWILKLNFIWRNLSRIVHPDVIKYPERHSLIPVNNGFIVPGGRFREFYYWDTYWVVEGLLLSGMEKTAKGMLENLLSMVEAYGFVPNGGRIYYLMRSQPPLLIPMVKKYVDSTNDTTFISKNLPLLEREFKYFHNEKSVSVIKGRKIYRMAHYVVTSEGPRPESYWEDYEEAQKHVKHVDEERFYAEIKAGAESGWDFSARWFISEGSAFGNLSDISTRNIVPVDLNAFLQRNARILADFHRMEGNSPRVKFYEDIARTYQRGIDHVLWNEDEGIWLDYDMKNARPRDIFYPTNLTPLYTESFNRTHREIYAKRAVEYLRRQRIGEFMGGTPASLDETGQQWDAPNAWPPLQSIIVQGLRNTRVHSAMSVAKELATRWLRAMYIGFHKYGHMFEKYDAREPGKFGAGGEYTCQQGFGWTNGVVFEFIDNYPNVTANELLCNSCTTDF
ncbi:trehalase-like [Fopius arisanus]|uniref:Trehalase n=1 Tax=Fopius arisanus TaxID=64838 RepID=A0A9R1TFI9_9HYME|nr:PREDICTED: trehalase-like [Fopius arisanus]